MNLRLIHIIMLLAAGWLLSSCRSDAPDDFAEGYEMQFTTAEATRASITKNLNTKGSAFALFGEKMFQGENDFHGPLVIFNGTKVEFKDNNWNYGEPQYWMPGHEYSFVALYPDSLLSKTYFSQEYDNPKLSFTYSVPRSDMDAVKKEDFADIVVATHRRIIDIDKNDPNKVGLPPHYDKSPVNLKFQHIMAVLDITPAVVDPLMYAGDDESKLDPDPNFNDTIIKNEFIQFRKIEFYGFQTKADFSVIPSQLTLPSAGQTYDNDTTINVDYSLPYANMTIEFTEQAAQHIVNNFPNCSIFEKDDAMIMLPHTLAEDSKIEMTYTVNLDTAEDPVIRHITIHPGPLKLEAGKYYKLCFTVEKVYEGQIREGSLHWIVTDLENDSDNDNWIDGGGTIRQEFDINDGKQ